eukprot:3218785-Amphidinium_carterae.1
MGKQKTFRNIVFADTTTLACVCTQEHRLQLVPSGQAEQTPVLDYSKGCLSTTKEQRCSVLRIDLLSFTPRHRIDHPDLAHHPH